SIRLPRFSHRIPPHCCRGALRRSSRLASTAATQSSGDALGRGTRRRRSAILRRRLPGNCADHSSRGATGFYVRRTATAARPSSAEDWLGYDAAGETAGWIVRVDADLRETSLLLEGIQCAACAWLNEEYLKRQAGVVAVSVNLATRRAHVRWGSRATRLSAVLRDRGHRLSCLSLRP